MRTIRKRPTPDDLAAWRQDRMASNDLVRYPFDYESMRRDKLVLEKVEDALFAEQGGICAYTGRMIRRQGNWGQAGFHIEHLKPQTHCAAGEDTDYRNMVACWPQPNQKQATEYGAVKKDKWPSSSELTLFVSPLQGGCSARFDFIDQEDSAEDGNESKYSNWIKPSIGSDIAALKTIQHLNLNHHELRALRWDAVIGALNPNDDGFLPLDELAKVAGSMDRAEQDLDAGSDVTLDPFCFAVRQAIARRIRKLE
jgi:uncharacterized protein (TIGR02646 family)